MERRTYNVGAWKIPYEQRDVAHAVLTATDDRGFFDIIGANDDPAVPYGAAVTYRVELTEAEADRFRAASNCRFVELDVTASRAVWLGAGATVIPAASSLAHMRAAYPDLAGFDGRDVPVAILDGGVSPEVIAYMGWTLGGKQTFGPDATGPDGYTDVHGCLVAPCGVPDGGIIYDAVVSNNAGSATASAFAAAVAWAVDEGVRVINYSFSGTVGAQTYIDAIVYAASRGAQLVCSAGNDGAATINYPAAYSTTYPNVHSSIAWNEDTDTLPGFSNHAASGTGCAPGVRVYGLTPAGVPTLWDGTSASAPHMARLIAMGATDGQRSPAQVAAALRANTRPTGRPASDQGGGAWDLHRALTALGLLPAPTVGADTVTVVGASGSAQSVSAYTLSPTSPLYQTGDLRVVTISAGSTVTMSTPSGWTLLREQSDETSLRVWVFARNWQPTDTSTVFDFDTATLFFSSFSVLVLRSAAGPIPPESVVPLLRFGTTTQVTSTSTWPLRTNDVLAVAFLQRDTAAPSGTLTVPAGLTSRGLYRPASGTTGHKQLLTTAVLSSADEVGAYASTSNVTGASCAVMFTIASAAAEQLALPGYCLGVEVGAVAGGASVVRRPDGVLPGDLLLAVSNSTPNGAYAPAGWEYAVGGAVSSLDVQVIVWRRVAAADEPESYTFPAMSGASATCAVLAFAQEQVGTSWEVVPSIAHVSTSASTTTPTTQSLTPRALQALNLAIFAPAAATGSHASHTPPPGMDELLDYVPASGAPARGLHIAGELVSAGATGTRTATRGGSPTAYISVPLGIVAVPLPALPTFREGHTAAAANLNDLRSLVNLLYKVNQGGLRTRKPLVTARAAAATVPSGSAVPVAWAAEDYDTAEFLAVGEQVLTVPAGLGGSYRVTFAAGLATAAGATSTSLVRCWVEVNGQPVCTGQGPMPTTQPSGVACGGPLQLDAGDTIRCFVSQSSGSSLALSTTTRISLRWIGT